MCWKTTSVFHTHVSTHFMLCNTFLTSWQATVSLSMLYSTRWHCPFKQRNRDTVLNSALQSAHTKLLRIRDRVSCEKCSALHLTWGHPMASDEHVMMTVCHDVFFPSELDWKYIMFYNKISLGLSMCNALLSSTWAKVCIPQKWCGGIEHSRNSRTHLR